MSRLYFSNQENEKSPPLISEPDLIQQNHLIEESKTVIVPEVIFDFLEKNYLAKIIKAELTPVLDILRNKENQMDCLLQCFGIAKYVQRGILPAGPIPTGSIADDKVLKVSTIGIPRVYNDLEIKIMDSGEFGGLMNGRRPLQMESAKAAVLEKTLRREAGKELTGFVHGLIYLGFNDSYVQAHAFYFFATEQEVLYVDNQHSKLVSEDKYPFFNSVIENSIYDFSVFNKNLFIIKIDNWFFRWGEKLEFQKLIKNIENIYPPQLLSLEDNPFFDYKFNPIERISDEFKDDDFPGNNDNLPVYSDKWEDLLLKFPDGSSTLDNNLQQEKLIDKNEISLSENNSSIFHSTMPEKFISDKLSHNIEEQKINTIPVHGSENNKKRKLNGNMYSLKIFRNTVPYFSESKISPVKKRKNLPDFSSPT